MGILSSFQNIFKIQELKNRVFFTLALLAVYRIGAHIPTPGINGEELSKFLAERGGALMGFFDMFSVKFDLQKEEIELKEKVNKY